MKIGDGGNTNGREGFLGTLGHCIRHSVYGIVLVWFLVQGPRFPSFRPGKGSRGTLGGRGK